LPAALGVWVFYISIEGGLIILVWDSGVFFAFAALCLSVCLWRWALLGLFACAALFALCPYGVGLSLFS
jgi:hypothetical protein